MSVEMRMMFLYHICMMVLFVSGGSLSKSQELIVAGALLAVFTAVSLRRRSEKHWHWRRPGNIAFLTAVGGALLIAFFLYAPGPLFPATNSRFLPWYLAGFGIGLFNLLSGLNLVQSTEAEFQSMCGDEVSSSPSASVPSPLLSAPSEQRWKTVARGAFKVYFLAVWLVGVSFFYVYGRAFGGGSPIPTASQFQPLTDHGKTVYISPSQRRLVDIFQAGMFIGIPSAIALALALHFVAKVKIFDNIQPPKDASSNETSIGNR
jgi:hypothetical protein